MVDAPYSAYLLIGAALLATIVVLRFSRLIARILIRSLLRPLGKGLAVIGRVLWRPFHHIAVRPFVSRARQIAKGGAGIKAPAQTGIQSGAGAAPFKALARIVEKGTAAEEALGEVPQDVISLFEKKWLPFRFVSANRAGVGLHETLSIEDGRANVEIAKKYYGRTIDNERVKTAILYEDSEEALIIELLRDADLVFFSVLRQFRVYVDRNIMWFLGILLVLLTAAGFAVLMLPLWLNKLEVFVVFLFVVLAARVVYYFAAVNNGTHLSLFVQTYFSRLSNQYRSAATAFSNVRNDRTAPLDEVETTANIWFVNLHWMSARQWLLDLYLRNCEYQIYRDKWWRIILMPVAFAFILGISIIWIGQLLSKYFGISASLAFDWGGWSEVLVLLMVGACILLSRGLLRAFWSEVSTESWPNFGTMDIKDAIERFIGPTVREVVDKRRNPYGGAPAPH
jgi:hypothetical protein